MERELIVIFVGEGDIFKSNKLISGNSCTRVIIIC